MQIDKKASGTAAELAVADDLIKRGMVLLDHQFNVPKVGELDLVMRYADQIFFIEVKARTDQESFGGGIGAITPSKLRKMKKAALYYAQKHNLMNNTLRFLAVSVPLLNNAPYPPFDYLPIEIT